MISEAIKGLFNSIPPPTHTPSPPPSDCQIRDNQELAEWNWDLCEKTKKKKKTTEEKQKWSCGTDSTVKEEGDEGKKKGRRRIQVNRTLETEQTAAQESPVYTSQHVRRLFLWERNKKK